MDAEKFKRMVSLLPRPEWVRGAIGYDDVSVLADLLEQGVPGPVIEIGVASGWSSALLLKLLSENPPQQNTWLYSYDISPDCYFDRSKKTGAAVDELVPEYAPHWEFSVGDAFDAGQDCLETPVSLAFIDANHCHPCPVVDLICLLSALKPNAWVVLHDVNLPNLRGFSPESRQNGPKFLFDAWPWEKWTVDSPNQNMGAIRLPDSNDDVRELCCSLLKTPWEYPIQNSFLSRLGLLHFENVAAGEPPIVGYFK